MNRLLKILQKQDSRLERLNRPHTLFSLAPRGTSGERGGSMRTTTHNPRNFNHFELPPTPRFMERAEVRAFPHSMFDVRCSMFDVSQLSSGNATATRTGLKSKLLFPLLALALLLHSNSAFACAACFGRSDSPLAQAMNWGIFSLLAVIASVLATIATFFIYLARKSAAVAAAAQDEALASTQKA